MKIKDSILHNKYVLYFIFLIALIDFLLLAYSNDYFHILIFGLVGYLTYQFSKNMIVILFMSIAITNIFKYASQSNVAEGFEVEEEDEVEEDEVEEEDEEDEVEEEVEESKNKNKLDKVFSSLSLEKDTGKKEKFSQDKNVVFTSEDDKEIEKNERMMVSQVKMLKTMNKYKPLLDTLQGITKNLAIVKGVVTQ
jgi:hypothetical protein